MLTSETAKSKFTDCTKQSLTYQYSKRNWPNVAV